MHVLRSSKSFEKYKIMQKLLSDPMTPHNNPEWRVITPTTLEKVGKYEYNEVWLFEIKYHNFHQQC